MNTRLTKENIIFEGDVMHDEKLNTLDAYVRETKELDTMLGLTEDCDKYADDICINYYPTYNYKTNEFYIIAAITIFVSDATFEEHYPNLFKEFEQLYLGNGGEYKIILTDKEKDLLFPMFKEYCIKECRDIDNPLKFKLDTFEDIVNVVKQQSLELERE